MPISTDHPFPRPKAGEQTETVIVRAEFVSDVIAAFREYRDSKRTDRVGQYRLTPQGIEKLAPDDEGVAKPVRLMASIPLTVEGWEVRNSTGADARLRFDRTAGDALALEFNLRSVGDYTNISHALPGATAAEPTVSLADLTTLEIKLVWNGDQPVTLEPKLVDDRDRIVGLMRFIEPSPRSQTLRVSPESLKGYFGARDFDFRRVRRFDLAVARKSVDQASQGTLEIRHVGLHGTGPVITDAATEQPDLVLAELALDAERWETAVSSRASITLSSEDDRLACNVELPYDRSTDGPHLPWTNLQTGMPRGDFRRLEAIRLEVRWLGNALVTLEPKIVCSADRRDTYGIFRRIEPSEEPQRVEIRLSDLRFFNNETGSESAAEMNLEKLVGFSLGISRKHENQSARGQLQITRIELLGRGNGKP